MALWEHQAQAVEAVCETLARGGRASTVMACGTGKTRVAAEVSRRLAPQGRALVVVPTLELLYQTTQQWKQHLGAQAGRIVAVCSEKEAAHNRSTVDAQEVAELQETGVLVSTDPAVLHADLDPPGRCTVLVTYQSLPVIVALTRQWGLSAWTLMVVDEAHRSAGTAGRAWTVLHEDAHIPVERRLYMTATPRLYGGDDAEVVSMDDETVFGRQVVHLSFAEAIERGLLADYRFVVAVVTDREVAALTEVGTAVSVNSDPLPASMLAAQIALARAIDEHGLHRVISYHATVAASQRFARTLPNAVDLLDRPADSAYIAGYHVDGQTSLEQRRHTLNYLRHPGNRTVIVSNCRVLGEGVDVPELDGVLFADPRASHIDVAQAVGRALRRGSNGPKVATIIAPILISEQESVQAALQDSRWDTVWRIMRALRAHDERLADDLDQRRARQGTRPHGQLTGGREPRWLVSGARITPAFAEAIRLRLVEHSTPRSVEMVARAREFHAEHGHLRVPRMRDGALCPLYRWLDNARGLRRRGHLAPHVVAALEELGIIWNPRRSRWEQGMALLRAYRDRTGHVDVPTQYVVDGFALGDWLAKERAAIRAGERDQGSVTALRDLGVTSEAQRSGQGRRPRWASPKGLAAARQFYECHGHLNVPYGTRYAGIDLGRWLSDVRAALRRGEVPPPLDKEFDAMGLERDPRPGPAPGIG
jgi:superfamily II DNA or RNA helicase